MEKLIVHEKHENHEMRRSFLFVSFVFFVEKNEIFGIGRTC